MVVRRTKYKAPWSYIKGKRHYRRTSPSGEVPKAEGAALAVKKTMLDYRKKRSLSGAGRRTGIDTKWTIAAIHAGEEPQKPQNLQNLQNPFQPVASGQKK